MERDRASGGARPRGISTRQFRWAAAGGRARQAPGRAPRRICPGYHHHHDDFGTKLNRATGTFVPRPIRFEVTGVFETGMYEYDNAYVFMSLAAAQDIAGLDSAVTGLEVKTTDRWRAPEIAPVLAQRLGFPYRTVDWQEQNSSLFQALKLEKLGMGVILLLIVVVAAFNIVSNLTMVVADKTKEIGILKAMGMTARSVRKVFLTQGLVIGFAGTFVGAGVGVGRVGRAREVQAHQAGSGDLFHRSPAGDDRMERRGADGPGVEYPHCGAGDAVPGAAGGGACPMRAIRHE